MSGLAVLSLTDQQRWHGLYKAAPLIIILLYMRTRGDRGVTQREIADNLGISRNTAANSIRQLVILGSIAKLSHNDGYILTDGGRQMLLDLDGPGCSKVEHPLLKESLNKDLKDSKDMKERKNGMLKNLACQDILANSKILFPGHEVISFGLPNNLEPEFVIAWMAQAYDQHQQGKISHPWALVYRRLQTNRSLPDKKYQEDPLAFLPNEFLAGLGLEAPKVIDLEDAGEDPEPKTVERVVEYSVTVDAEVYDAWIAVQEQLRGEMPKASFETWVQETYPVDFSNKVLTVEARNLYAADWLRSRLASKVQQMLIRIFKDADIRVEFVVVTNQVVG